MPITKNVVIVILSLMVTFIISLCAGWSWISIGIAVFAVVAASACIGKKPGPKQILRH